MGEDSEAIWDLTARKSRVKMKKAGPSRPVINKKRRVAAEPYVRMGFLVHDVSRMRRTLFDQAVKNLGITRAQWWALANLSREGEGITQSQLAQALDVGKVTIGGLLDRLETAAYIVRKADRTDRRLKRVFITERGYGIMDEMAAIGRQLNSVVMKGISIDQIHLAEEVLHQMRQNLRMELRGPSSEVGALDDGLEDHLDISEGAEL
ncbi:MarR family winged helix-turn-helix transcriptional regulator [Sphingobium sp. YR768]|uniref:MarR family winged helix-turn-helix transcriptional regulator n=1 Tax=Sphingobium sp. YR768 TaxID=1884365 RepID=UPI001C43401B|nr:MarR family transcriptional regulator [Sphingobium sp. YR768]